MSGVVDARRGTHVGRGGMSWNTRLSLMHVVGNKHVVDVCRGQQSFLGHVVETMKVCRGTQACRESMSWSTCFMT